MNPLTTGTVAHVLNVSEPTLNSLVRRRKIDPAPTVISGRAFWEPSQVLQAAQILGVSLSMEELEEEVRRA